MTSRYGLLISLLVYSAGCGPNSPSHAARAVSPSANAFLDSEHFVNLQPTLAWTFAQEESPFTWNACGTGQQFEVSDGELEMRPSTADPQLCRHVRLDASAVDEMRVFMWRDETPTVDPPQLFWARTGEEFSPERMMAATGIGRQGEHIFELSQASTWSGPIERVRLDPTTLAGRRIRVWRVEGFRKQLNQDALYETLGDAWKVDLDRDVRNAMLVPPGHAITHAVTVGPQSQLRFAVGVWREVTRPGGSRFRVTATFRSTDGGSRRLGEWASDPDVRPHDNWRDVAMDLSPLAGRSGVVSLEAHADDPVDLLRGIPLIANAEVVVRRGRRHPSVVLISVDTLRADRLSLYGHDVNTSPRIDVWARRAGVTFETTIASAPWTLPSHVSLLTGLDTLRHGVNHESPMPADVSTLADVLNDAGYATRAITDGGYMHPRYGLAQGFDEYHYRDPRWFKAKTLQKDGLALSIDGALRFLEENADRPVFLFLHTYDVHGPYRDRSVTDGASSADSGAPHVTVERLPLDESASFIPQYRPRWQSSNGILGEPLTEAELRSLPALYDDGIASVDHQLGRLFDYLRVSGLERDTIVVLTSDHGEMLGEGGSFGHNYLFDENLQVPLIVAYPGAVPGARVPSQVRSIDIRPTILDLAGVDPLTGIDGTSLTALINGGTDVPRDAWSYGPATNAGVSLRTATGPKYIFNNTAFLPSAARERVNDLGESRRRSHASDEGLGGIADLRRRTRERLSRVPGMRIQLAAASASLSGEIQSPWLGQNTIKIADELEDCVTWRGPGRVSIAVSPRTTCTIGLEDVGTSSLRVVARVDAGNGRDVVLDRLFAIGELGEPAVVALEEGTWTELSGPHDVAPHVKVWRVGTSTGTPMVPDRLDSRRLRQLQALGYIR